MKKRLFAILLAALLVLPAFAACGKSDEEPSVSSQDTTTAATTTAAVGEDTTADQTETTTEGYAVKDNLPEDLKFDGEVISIISRGRSWCKDEVSVEDLTGDVINDAIYNRNAAVEDRLGVTIENFLTTGNDNYAITETIRKQVQAGTEEYNLLANSVYATIMYTADNLFQNVTDLKYLDLEQPYWSQGFNRAASIGDAQYFVDGAICLSMYRFVFATFFNKDMFDEYKIPYLYDVVEQGKWTLDYQRELTKNIYTDLNGDGIKNIGDRFGFMTNHDTTGVDSYWSSCDLPILDKDDNNFLRYAVDAERLAAAVDKINALLWENDGSYLVEYMAGDSDQDEIASRFSQDQAATVTLRLIHVESEDMRNMTSKYGIVPMPKLDEAQTEYYSYAHDTMTAYAIPLTVIGDELEMIGAFLEALAAESYRTVTPAYYELALKTKYVSDEESVKMLDLVIDSFYVDAGVLYTKKISSFHQNMRMWIGNNRNTVSSMIKSTERVIIKQLGELNEGIAALQ